MPICSDLVRHVKRLQEQKASEMSHSTSNSMCVINDLYICTTTPSEESSQYDMGIPILITHTCKRGKVIGVCVHIYYIFNRHIVSICVACIYNILHQILNIAAEQHQCWQIYLKFNLLICPYKLIFFSGSCLCLAGKGSHQELTHNS